PIPVDSRIAKISWSSGVAEVEDCKLRSWSDVIKVITSKPRVVQEAWNLIAKRCKIPPLHLDSILWLVGGFIVKGSSRRDAVEGASKALSRLLSKDVNEVLGIVNELIARYL
ncbi:MAG: N-glycosylase/DNA lyase, partial [Candidatus Nezhaarchaeales archaeon]